VATLSTNLAANVVSPANGFSNAWPRRISFRTGGIITCVIGVVMMPWYLYNDLGAYIFTWLIGYSALLGPIAGIMLCDYFVLRRTRLDAAALYDPHGVYGGTNWRAIVSLVLAVLPNLPGFTAQPAGVHQRGDGTLDLLGGLRPDLQLCLVRRASPRRYHLLRADEGPGASSRRPRGHGVMP
jgi:cytosine/uracil/thiamine/allantoin permease